jgi:ribosomal protein L11 methylase PrmA
MDSGLYQDLTTAELLIPHEELSKYDQESPPPELVIKPEQVAFISYPYEWSFSQLKHAAQLTLRIQKIALQRGMSLKDSSAYNIQFHRGKPVLIDTLSFERYQEGEPWVAYRQFCQHFLAPLALMAYTDVRLSQLMRVYIDGIPLDLASKLLPKKTSLNLSINMHIHLHAKSQARYSEVEIDLDKNRRQMQVHQLLGLVDNLASAINKLSWQAGQTDWAEYDQFHNYSAVALQHKQDLVAEFLTQTQSTTLWDLGANIGKFSRIASQQQIDTIAYDIDPGAVERNYLRAVEEGDEHIIPLISDLTNPSPGLGWALEERQSLLDRGPVDTVFALALIHHLVIGNNVPLSYLASFFSRICQWLIIEFIPKSDPQIKKLLQVRKDIFTDYNQDRFLDEFNIFFTLFDQQQIKETDRVLFLFQNKTVPAS